MGDPKNLAVLIAESKDGRHRFRIAPVYDEAIVQRLATELAVQLNHQLEEKRYLNPDGRGADTPPVAVATSSAEDESVARPEDAAMTVSMVGDTEVFQLPAEGYRPFNICTVAGSVSLSGAVIAMLSVLPGPINDKEVGILLASGMFAMLGVGLFVLAKHLAVRSVTIGVDDEHLSIEQVSVWGVKTSDYTRRELSRILVGASAVEDNEEPVMELQVFDQDGKKEGLLSRLDDAELRWMAAHLRQRLQLPEYTGEARRAIEEAELDPSWPAPPPDTRIEFDNGPEFENYVVNRTTWRDTAVTVAIALITLVVGAIISGLLLTKDEFVVGVIVACVSSIGAIAFAVLRTELQLRRVEFDLGKDALHIQRVGLWRAHFDIPRGALHAVKVRDSGMKVNAITQYQLWLKADGKPVILMTGRPMAELAFMAAKLDRWRRNGEGDEAPDEAPQSLRPPVSM